MQHILLWSDIFILMLIPSEWERCFCCSVVRENKIKTRQTRIGRWAVTCRCNTEQDKTRWIDHRYHIFDIKLKATADKLSTQKCKHEHNSTKKNFPDASSRAAGLTSVVLQQHYSGVNCAGARINRAGCWCDTDLSVGRRWRNLVEAFWCIHLRVKRKRTVRFNTVIRRLGELGWRKTYLVLRVVYRKRFCCDNPVPLCQPLFWAVTINPACPVT